MFKEGNLVRFKNENGDGEVVRVVEDSDSFAGTTLCSRQVEGNEDPVMNDTEDLELVAESQLELDKVPNPQPMEEQTVVIVSFEGVVKREVKAIRETLKNCESLSGFKLSVTAKGPLNSGEVKISYSLSEDEYGNGMVSGDNLKECVAELLRRHGWEKVHSPKAISYDGIPF